MTIDQREVREGADWARRTLGKPNTTPSHRGESDSADARRAEVREEVEAEVAQFDAEQARRREIDRGRAQFDHATRYGRAAERQTRRLS